MIKIVLLRHGESIWNKENLFTGWTDVDLSDQGKGRGEASRRVTQGGRDSPSTWHSHPCSSGRSERSGSRWTSWI